MPRLRGIFEARAHSIPLLFRHELMHYVPDTYGVDVNDDGGNGCESPD